MEMNKQERKMEDCQEFTFLSIDGFHEDAEIIKLSAGNEEDAWELLEESKTSNTSHEVLLTERLRTKLKEVLK